MKRGENGFEDIYKILNALADWILSKTQRDRARQVDRVQPYPKLTGNQRTVSYKDARQSSGNSVRGGGCRQSRQSPSLV